MAQTREEILLPMAWEILDACNGFSFDMGGSVLKLVFIDKTEWVQPSARKMGSVGCLRLVNFSRNEIEEALDFINERVYFPRKSSDEILDIYSTGFGGTQYAVDFKKKIHVNNHQLMETDCFNQSFMYLLKNLPRNQVLHPVCRPAFEVVQKIREFENKTMEATKGLSESFDQLVIVELEDLQLKDENKNLTKPLIEDNDIFPCAIAMCGSGVGFTMVQKDGTSRIVDVTMRGGKTLLAYGSLLTGTKTFGELMELAAKGQWHNVSDTNNSLLKDTTASGGEDMYGKWVDAIKKDGNETPEQLIFYFGQAFGKSISDFKREDMARCLLHTHMSDLAQFCYTNAVFHGIKHVFFCGGIINHPIAREAFTYEWLLKENVSSLMNPVWKQQIQAHFMIHGQSLGAIGALLNHKTKWSEKNKTIA